jgi:hypothetical protein
VTTCVYSYASIRMITTRNLGLFLLQLLAIYSQDVKQTCSAQDATCYNPELPPKVGEIAPLGQNAFEIGVPSELITKLSSFCGERSIIELFQAIQDIPFPRQEIVPLDPGEEDE